MIEAEQNHKVAVISDYDRCAFDTHRLTQNMLRHIAHAYELSEADSEQLYREVMGHEDTIDLHEALQRREIDFADYLQKQTGLRKGSRDYLFPGARQLLSTYPSAVVTVGHEDQQEYKLRLGGIPPEQSHILPPGSNKGEFIRDRIIPAEGGVQIPLIDTELVFEHVVVLDDRASQIASLMVVNSVHPIAVIRQGSKYEHEEVPDGLTVVQDLRDVPQLIEDLGVQRDAA